MTRGELKPSITGERQRYVDDPIYLEPKRRSQIEAAVADIFKRPPPQSLLAGHNRVRLRWMTPDGEGGFIPRKE